jgi:iron(III) transport system ATP-binding protein
MASIELRGISKLYPGVQALDDVRLEIESGELFTLLGPSGCGKTTLLRTVAGFIRQDGGEILIDGKRIDGLPAYQRDTGMVFQDYAIFPHMTVGENVAFGLRYRKVERKEVAKRVAAALETVRLSGYEGRKPSELSGGQQQRVGLARAMVIRPQVLLMDEPLSNLDAKLRIELREDIREIQKQLGITTIYVTHDQEEALVISDRVCIMRSGVVEQVGSAWAVYKQPATHFVAAFVGSMNFVEGPLFAAARDPSAPVPEAVSRALDSEPGTVMAGIRPEDVHIVADAEAPQSDGLELDAVIGKISFTGREAQYHVELPDGGALVVHVSRPSARLLDKAGAPIRVVLPYSALLFFDAGTQRRL